MSEIKNEREKTLTFTHEAKEGLCRLLFLSWENDLAYSTDVPRAIWFCDLQFGERWHDAAGEISECRAGWLDGILKHLGAKNKHTTAVRGRQTQKLTHLLWLVSNSMKNSSGEIWWIWMIIIVTNVHVDAVLHFIRWGGIHSKHFKSDEWIYIQYNMRPTLSAHHRFL